MKKSGMKMKGNERMAKYEVFLIGLFVCFKESKFSTT